MSTSDQLIQEVLKAQKIYDDWERSVGGPDVAKVVRLQMEMEAAADRTNPLGIAHPNVNLSGREQLIQLTRRLELDTAGAEGLRRTLATVDAHFSLHELRRQIELQDLSTITLGNQIVEASFGAALRSISPNLQIESLWHEIAKVSQPWINLSDPYRSFEAFGALSELASIHEPTTDDDADVDPRIDDIPAPAARAVGRAAGLAIHEVEARIDLGARRNIGILLAGTGTWSNEAGMQLQSVEVMLRLRLEEYLTRQLGAYWYKQRVAKAVLESWRSRQSEARVGESANLLDFSTLGELRDILLRNDVWPVISQDVRMTKEEFAVVLDHLMEIRHAVMHSRTLSRRHFVWCFADVDRILQAFGFEAPPE